MKMIIWTEPALKDLDDIVNYFSKDSINTALKQYTKIIETTKALKKIPEQGRTIPELKHQNILKFRELIEYPWRIMYENNGNNILLLAVLDGRRNIEDIIMNRNMR